MEDRNYEVVYLLDEYITEESLNTIFNYVDTYETTNTSLILWWTGHIIAPNEDINNDTQALTLADANIITDNTFASMTSLWDSLNQVFIIDGCHSEGFGYELQQPDRVIFNASGVTETDALDEELTKFSVFYYFFIMTWDDALSVEENFINIREVIIQSGYGFTPVLFDDDENEETYI